MMPYIGGCQNYGPLLGPLVILMTQKKTTILTTTHIMNLYLDLHLYLYPR